MIPLLLLTATTAGVQRQIDGLLPPPRQPLPSAQSSNVQRGYGAEKYRCNIREIGLSLNAHRLFIIRDRSRTLFRAYFEFAEFLSPFLALTRFKLIFRFLAKERGENRGKLRDYWRGNNYIYKNKNRVIELDRYLGESG